MALPVGVTRRACYDSATDSFANAATAGVIEHRVRIAGETVALRFADTEMARDLGAAFTHLPAVTTGPTLVIDVWESLRSGGPVPLITEEAVDGGVTAATRLDGDQPIECRYDGERRILNVFDRSADTGLFWVADASALPHWERGSPFRQLLAWFFRARGTHLLHGAALGSNEAGVLLVGPGGSGKSSSALACLEWTDAGVGFASDDYCAVRDESRATGWSLYCTAKVGWAQLEWFPTLARWVVNRGDPEAEKALLVFEPPAGPPVVDRVALDAIVLPTVDPDGVTSIEPVGRAEALRALAPSSIFQLAGPNAADFRELAAFVASRPAFRLRLGGDPSVVPTLLADLIASLAP